MGILVCYVERRALTRTPHLLRCKTRRDVWRMLRHTVSRPYAAGWGASHARFTCAAAAQHVIDAQTSRHEHHHEMGPANRGIVGTRESPRTGQREAEAAAARQATSRARLG